MSSFRDGCGHDKPQATRERVRLDKNPQEKPSAAVYLTALASHSMNDHRSADLLAVELEESARVVGERSDRRECSGAPKKTQVYPGDAARASTWRARS